MHICNNLRQNVPLCLFLKPYGYTSLPCIPTGRYVDARVLFRILVVVMYNLHLLCCDYWSSGCNNWCHDLELKTFVASPIYIYMTCDLLSRDCISILTYIVFILKNILPLSYSHGYIWFVLVCFTCNHQLYCHVSMIFNMIVMTFCFILLRVSYLFA